MPEPKVKKILPINPVVTFKKTVMDSNGKPEIGADGNPKEIYYKRIWLDSGGEGVQEKAPGTGAYILINKQGEAVNDKGDPIPVGKPIEIAYIKSSLHEPGDDEWEKITSQLGNTIAGKAFVPTETVKPNSDKGFESDRAELDVQEKIRASKGYWQNQARSKLSSKIPLIPYDQIPAKDLKILPISESYLASKIYLDKNKSNFSNFVVQKEGPFDVKQLEITGPGDFFPESIKGQLKSKGEFWLVGADPFWAKKRDNIYKILNEDETGQLKDDMGLILATCLLFADYDCQVGNMIFYTDENNNLRLASFDHGWAAADICKPEKEKINLFGTRTPYPGKEKAAGHTGGNAPTNHFNDYPKIVLSEHFVKGLKTVIEKEKLLLANISKELDKINQDFPGEENAGTRLNLLKERAKHIGVVIPGGIRDIDDNSIKAKQADVLNKLIIQSFSGSMNKRIQGLTVVKDLINIQVNKSNSEEANKAYEQLSETLHNTVNNNGESIFENITDFISPDDDLGRYDLESIKQMSLDRIAKAGENPDQAREALAVLKFINSGLSKKMTPKELSQKEESISNAESSINVSKQLRSQQNNFDSGAMHGRQRADSSIISKPSSPILTASAIASRPSIVVHGQIANIDVNYFKAFAKMVMDNTKNVLTNTKDFTYQLLPNNVAQFFVNKEKEPRVSAASKGTTITIQETRPSSDDANIKIIANALIATGDPRPVIRKGSPDKIINLLKALSENDKIVKPQINVDNATKKALESDKRYIELMEKFAKKESSLGSTIRPANLTSGGAAAAAAAAAASHPEPKNPNKRKSGSS